jgi:hypothetical protein
MYMIMIMKMNMKMNTDKDRDSNRDKDIIRHRYHTVKPSLRSATRANLVMCVSPYNHLRPQLKTIRVLYGETLYQTAVVC